MTRPLFALYVTWHPSYSRGRELADRIRTHFGRDRRSAVGEWRGISVLERSAPVPKARTPLPIDWDDAEFTAVVVLTEATLVDDNAWVGYVRDTARAAQEKGIPAGFFPVTMERRGLELEFAQQALRWDQWKKSDENRIQRLMSDLTHEFCRMLRHRIDRLRGTGGGEEEIGCYLEKIRVFISHSKHDGDGEDGDGELVGRGIRDWIHEHSLLDSFFDVYDIPPGSSVEEVLLHHIGAVGAVVAVHTDSYSSRDWCRREVIEAKRRLVPMVVVDCLRDIDPRGMAYLGNAPIIRMNPDRKDRIAAIVGCILDEVFRTWLWLCRVGRHLTESPGVVFMARPPELITLAALPLPDEESVTTIVYPEPLLSADEARLFGEIAPEVRLRTLTDWLPEERP